jgi:hypothetical protein
MVRTTHRSRSVKKLYAVQNKKGRAGKHLNPTRFAEAASIESKYKSTIQPMTCAWSKIERLRKLKYIETK